MDSRTHISRYALLLAILGAAGILGATAKDIADAVGAPAAVVVGIAITSGLFAIAAGAVTYHQSQRQEERDRVQKQADEERDVVTRLLAFLEDRRLLTGETGYQSHFPDDLRQSAEEIRRQTNLALQQISRDSPLAPILKRIQTAARRFQEATEGAMDGTRAGGGMTPSLPMGWAPFLRALADYREEIALGMKAAADLNDLELDPVFTIGYERGQEELRESAEYWESGSGGTTRSQKRREDN